MHCLVCQPQERGTLLFFLLAEGMADSSLGKEILLKSIPDEVVFCHPIFPGEPYFRAYHVIIKE